MSRIKKTLLALDFDGVIADSIAECLVVAHNAFNRLSGTGRIIASLEELEAAQVAESRRIRNFIRSGEDYVYIQLALQMKAKIVDQLDFDRFKAEHADRCELYLDAFYSERSDFLRRRRRAWLELNPLYPGMAAFLRDHPDPGSLFIVTTKKLSFVRKILLAGGIRMADGQMFHALPGRSKRQILLSVLENRGAAPAYLDFVDDQVDTLVEVSETGVRCWLAAWGYNDAEQAGRARRAGIAVISLAEFYRRFS